MTHPLETLILRAAPPLQLKLAASDIASGSVFGYASTFGGEPDSYGDIIAPGAFRKGLADLRSRGESVPMLWTHDQAAVIGRWTSLIEDNRGLLVRGQLNLDTERGREAHAHIKAGDVTGLSIGYREGAARSNADGTQTLLELELREISVVAFPANRNARIEGVKSLGSQRELQALLHASGLSRKAAERVASGGWPALNTSEPQPDFSNFTARIKAAAAQLRSTKG